MQTEQFEGIIRQQIELCERVLIVKAREYATEDRLHNFRVAAALQGISERKALAGMLAKHTVSIFDLCSDADAASIETWDEKITDHINYLLLLKALVVDEHNHAAAAILAR